MAKKFSAKSAKNAPERIAFWGDVAATYGRHHWVEDDAGHIFEAHRRGKKDDVVVGDRVGCTAPSGNVVAIEEIAPRRNLLFRSDVFRVKELAANVDLVAVVFASRPTFNPHFVWRALVAAKTAGIDTLVIRNKTDLAEGAQEAGRFLCELENLGEAVLSCSAAAQPAELKAALYARFSGKRVLLVGQSGMGKSSIVNALIENAGVRTREFSEALDIGKQTTTATRTYAGPGFSLIDSPGFQEFGLNHLTQDDVLRAMPDIARYARDCRFYNCTHTREPGCSVHKALEEGLVNAGRWAFYCALCESLRSRSQ